MFLDAFLQFLGLPERVPTPARPKVLPAQPRRAIVLDNVGFQNPSGGPHVLDEVAAEIKVGEKVALVGPNGAGKTTLLKLLCRFYDPTVGRISLDDIGFEECDPAQLRSRLACVFQDFVRYDLTANENIRLGRAAEASMDAEEEPKAKRPKRSCRTPADE